MRPDIFQSKHRHSYLFMVHLMVYKDGLYHTGSKNLKRVSEGIYLACGMKKSERGESWQNKRCILQFIITTVIIRIPTASDYNVNIFRALDFFSYFFFFLIICGVFHKNEKIMDFGSWCFRWWLLKQKAVSLLFNWQETENEGIWSSSDNQPPSGTVFHESS